jgi:hypothetical protein
MKEMEGMEKGEKLFLLFGSWKTNKEGDRPFFLLKSIHCVILYKINSNITI